MDFWNNVYEKIVAKTKAECERLGTDIPYIPTDGRYKDISIEETTAAQGINWWTNGFWAGLLWQMYNATGDEGFKNSANGVEKRLDEALHGFLGLHHDVGFQWLHTSVANYRLTGDKDSRRRGLHAATILAGRYTPAGKFIRAWNGERTGWSIVDTMMNLPLLHWAGKELDDPRFSYIANSHADTCMNAIIRPDGSCNHIVCFDPATGEFLDNPKGQGYESGSSWSRGTAWAIYGYALCYFHTKERKYLDCAKQIAHYFISNIAVSDWLPLVDFRAPAEPVCYDSSAAMIAACGMLEIAELVPELERSFYTKAAHKTLIACENHFCNWDTDVDGIVYAGASSYHSNDKSRNTSLIYGDYFFIEAVLKILGKGFRIW